MVINFALILGQVLFWVFGLALILALTAGWVFIILLPPLILLCSTGTWLLLILKKTPIWGVKPSGDILPSAIPIIRDTNKQPSLLIWSQRFTMKDSKEHLKQIKLGATEKGAYTKNVFEVTV